MTKGRAFLSETIENNKTNSSVLATNSTDNQNGGITAINTGVFVMGLLLVGSSLYVMVAVALHRVRWNRAIKQGFRESNGAVVRRKESASSILGNLSLAAAVLAFLNCCSDRPFVYVRETSDVTCKVMQCFSFLFYGSGISCLYSFLWVRQRACYKSPSLIESYGKLARYTSFVILPVFLLMMLAGMVLTLSLWTFESSKIGCIETSGSVSPLAVLYAGSLTMQITLLGLFIYPLKDHIKLWHKGSFQSSTDELFNSLVRRSIATTALCIATDTLAFVLTKVIRFEQFIYINYIYDVNLICDVMFIIGSYADWRQRICLCCSKPLDGELNTFQPVSSYKASTKTSV